MNSSHHTMPVSKGEDGILLHTDNTKYTVYWPSIARVTKHLKDKDIIVLTFENASNEETETAIHAYADYKNGLKKRKKSETTSASSEVDYSTHWGYQIGLSRDDLSVKEVAKLFIGRQKADMILIEKVNALTGEKHDNIRDAAHAIAHAEISVRFKDAESEIEEVLKRNGIPAAQLKL